MNSLLAQAQSACRNAYAPYSEYAVGAALEAVDGTVYTGCNVENANYSNSLHAEEVALGAAVASGHRAFERLAVVSSGNRVVPCGTCRQSLAEFCDDGFEIVCGSGTNSTPASTTYTLGELLPEAFRTSYLERGATTVDEGAIHSNDDPTQREQGGTGDEGIGEAETGEGDTDDE